MTDDEKFEAANEVAHKLLDAFEAEIHRLRTQDIPNDELGDVMSLAAVLAFSVEQKGCGDGLNDAIGYLRKLWHSTALVDRKLMN